MSFAARWVEEIVQGDDIWMIQQPHHLQLAILNAPNQQMIAKLKICLTLTINNRRTVA